MGNGGCESMTVFWQASRESQGLKETSLLTNTSHSSNSKNHESC